MWNSNPDVSLRKLERSYASCPTPVKLEALNRSKQRHGYTTELGVAHLQYLAETLAAIIGAEIVSCK